MLRTLRGSTSQAQIAAIFGIAQQTYAGWENNRRNPSITELCGIAKHFEVSVDWLLGLTDDPTPRKSSGGVHINGVSHSVVNGHAVNSSISNGGGNDGLLHNHVVDLKNSLDRLAANDKVKSALSAIHMLEVQGDRAHAYEYLDKRWKIKSVHDTVDHLVRGKGRPMDYRDASRKTTHDEHNDLRIKLLAVALLEIAVALGVPIETA